MTQHFKKRAQILTKKRELYQLLLSLDPDLMTDDEVDLMYTLSKDKQIQQVLSLKAKLNGTRG
jgi:hypothetical protein